MPQKCLEEWGDEDPQEHLTEPFARQLQVFGLSNNSKRNREEKTTQPTNPSNNQPTHPSGSPGCLVEKSLAKLCCQVHCQWLWLRILLLILAFRCPRRTWSKEATVAYWASKGTYYLYGFSPKNDPPGKTTLDFGVFIFPFLKLGGILGTRYFWANFWEAPNLKEQPSQPPSRPTSTASGHNSYPASLRVPSRPPWKNNESSPKHRGCGSKIPATPKNLLLKGKTNPNCGPWRVFFSTHDHQSWWQFVTRRGPTLSAPSPAQTPQRKSGQKKKLFRFRVYWGKKQVLTRTHLDLVDLLDSSFLSSWMLQAPHPKHHPSTSSNLIWIKRPSGWTPL